MLGWSGIVIAACTASDPNGPMDGGADASSDSAADGGEASVADAHAEDGSPDADLADADGAVDEDANGDSDGQANADGAANADAGGEGDSAANADAGGDGGLPGALLLPAENDAAYEMRATCIVKPVNRVGAVDSCCRQSIFTAETRCDTVVHERLDASGNLALEIEPMQACVTAVSGETCSRTGLLARCDSNGLTCPFTPSAPGGLAALAGTYPRRTVGDPGTASLSDHYWSGCAVASMAPVANPSCSTGSGGVTPTATTRMSTIVRTGAGELTLVSSWTTSPPFRACSTPSAVPVVKTLGSTSFVANASSMGGTFSLTGYTCTYVLTKK